MQYRLRTLLILATIGPPILAGIWFWGLSAFLFWIMPRSYVWAVIIGVINGVGFMLAGVFWQWWWAAHVARRPKHSK